METYLCAVFVPYFEEQYFGGAEPKDEDVYSFLVAVTRARKEISLISVTDKVPKILTWIEKGKLEENLMT